MVSHADPIEVQFGLAHDCIRACIYGDFIGRKEPKKAAWFSIMDMCYADAVLSWNQIFGSDSQPAHWKKLADRLPVPERSKLMPFGKGMVAEYIGVSIPEWEAFHAAMVVVRNTNLAHFDHKKPPPELPNLTWVLHSAYLYREWLLQLLREYKDQGYALNIDETTGPEILEMLRKQIAEICV